MLFSTFHRRRAETLAGRQRTGRSRSTCFEPTAHRLLIEPLEDRTLLSFGFGWAFNFGGTNQDVGNRITTDTSGNLYVAGWFLSSCEPTTHRRAFSDSAS
jgi:hypothetical protein